MTELPLEGIGLRVITLREYYATFNTLTAPSSADLERQDKLFAVRFNGEALGQGKLRMNADDPLTFKFEKSYEEALDLARLLLALDLDPVDITAQPEPRPDMRVMFSNGDEQDVEVGRITDEAGAARAGAIDYIKVGIIRRFVKDEAFRQSVAGAHIVISFSEVPLSATDRATCVDELVRYFKQHRVPRPASAIQIAITEASYPTLHRYGATFTVSSRVGWFLTVRQPPNPRSAEIAREKFEELLASKQQKHYEAKSPIWLALAISDAEQIEADALAAIRPELLNTPLGQFSRIIVGYERDAETIPRVS